MTTYTDTTDGGSHYVGRFPPEVCDAVLADPRTPVNSTTWCGSAPGTVAMTDVTFTRLDDGELWVETVLTRDVFGWSGDVRDVDFATLPIGVCVDGVVLKDVNGD